MKFHEIFDQVCEAYGISSKLYRVTFIYPVPYQLMLDKIAISSKYDGRELGWTVLPCMSQGMITRCVIRPSKLYNKGDLERCYEGEAVCNLDKDEYRKHTGRMIAFNRALRKMISGEGLSLTPQTRALRERKHGTRVRSKQTAS